MSDLTAFAPYATAFLIGGAVIMAAARVLLRRRRVATGDRGPVWRVAALIGLQLCAGAILYSGLHEPSRDTGVRTLTVATRHARPSSAEPAGMGVALPEAGHLAGFERTPDLATALRLHPQATRLHILGEGLTPRDRRALHGFQGAVVIDPPPTPSGLVELSAPPTAAAGGAFSIGGRVGATPGLIELVDPAGAIVSKTRVGVGGRFVLTGSVKAAGLALFELRLRSTDGVIIDRVRAPIDVRDDPPARVAVLAGAPNADLLFLRRWAEEAGVQLTVETALGAGVRLGQAVALDAATLAKTDLLVIDDRRWETLSAADRAAIAQALDAGLGVLLRPSPGVSASTLRDWTLLGAPGVGPQRPETLRLTGEGADKQQSAPASPSAATEMTRLWPDAPDSSAVSVLKDARGQPLSRWRARGRGRVAVWTITDSYVLRLSGQSDGYGEMWGALFANLARPMPARSPRLVGFTRAREYGSICGLTAERTPLTGPSGRTTIVLTDPASGIAACGGFWPIESGWHILRGAGAETPLYVHLADAAPGLRAWDARQATRALATAGRPRPVATLQQARPWAWLLALVMVFAGLWWLERWRPRRVVRPDAE